MMASNADDSMDDGVFGGDALHRSDSNVLAGLLGIGTDPAPVWPSGELAAILRHQLAAPLHVDLGGALLELDRVLEESGEFQGLRSMTFGDLFSHRSPPLEALRLVKEFGKVWRKSAKPVLPPEIATVLYYASVLIADVRLGQRISRLSRPAVLSGIEWLLSRPWLEKPLRTILDEGRERLRRPDERDGRPSEARESSG